MSAYQMLIDGKWKSNGQSMPVVSPFNEEVIATVPVASAEDVQSALDSAAKAQKAWGKRSGVERGAILRRLAELVERDKDRLAQLLSQGTRQTAAGSGWRDRFWQELAHLLR